MSARGGWGQWYPDAQVVWFMPGAGLAPIIPLLPVTESQQPALPGMAIQAGMFSFPHKNRLNWVSGLPGNPGSFAPHCTLCWE